MPVMLKALLGALLVAVSAAGPPELRAQTAAEQPAPGAALLPSDVSFVVRVDAVELAKSQLLPRLLEHPQAANPLAEALAEPSTLARIGTAYVGFPAGFTPEDWEIPVLLIGSFDAGRLLADLADEPGISLTRRGGRTFLIADWDLGTTWATALGGGILALGDQASVLEMVEVFGGRRKGNASVLADALNLTGDVVGVGRIPVALRGWLQAKGGSLAAPFATIDRVSFQGSLGRTINMRMSLFPTTAEGRQAIEQALGAVRMFGPSRFADDPEILSAIQSLRYTVGSDRVDVTLSVPRSLLLQML